MSGILVYNQVYRLYMDGHLFIGKVLIIKRERKRWLIMVALSVIGKIPVHFYRSKSSQQQRQGGISKPWRAFNFKSITGSVSKQQLLKKLHTLYPLNYVPVSVLLHAVNFAWIFQTTANVFRLFRRFNFLNFS